MKNQLFSSLTNTKLKTSGEGCHGSQSGYIFMANKFIISFVLCIGVLIACEYFFLQELYSQQRFSVMALTSIGAVTSILTFWVFYKKYSKTAR